MAKITMAHMIEVLDKEIVIGFEYTKAGGSKKITHNPYSKMTALYINGICHLNTQDTQEVMDEYNKIESK